MRIHLPGIVLAIALAAGCGGSKTSPSGNTITSPSDTISMTEAAPSLGQAVASTIHAALETGSAQSAQAAGQASLFERLVRFFGPVTLHAQSSFAANCSRGGNVNIRYSGLRPVVMSGSEAVFSRCGTSIRNRDVFFSGTIRLTGHWTAQSPGPIGVSGPIQVEQIGEALLNGSLNGQQYNGSVAGVTVGTPDTNPPPNPNSCPGTLSRTSIEVPAGGGNYTVTLTVGTNCPWSTTSWPGWVTMTAGNGRGGAQVSFTVSANGGGARAGTITVNGLNIAISQLAGGTPPPPAGSPFAAAVGQWSGTISGNNPCSVGNPVGNYNWTGTLSLSGSTFSLVWRDSYFGFTRTFTFPAANTFSFTVRDGSDVFNLTGRFSSDLQSLSGELAAQIDCFTSVRPTTGTWQGRRTGP